MMHILLVDDDSNFRRSLLIQLELEGYQVTEAENANQAFSFLKKCQGKGKFPDIVITDVRMPEIPGSEFVMKLQKEFPSLLVLVISAFGLPDELMGYPFLKKPFKIQQMMSIMDKSLHDSSML